VKGMSPIELAASAAVADALLLFELSHAVFSTPDYRTGIARDAGFPCCFGPHCPTCRACPQMMAFRPWCSRRHYEMWDHPLEPLDDTVHLGASIAALRAAAQRSRAQRLDGYIYP